MRRREPFGRGVAASTGPSSSQLARANQHAVAVGGGRQPGGRDELVGPCAADPGQRAERRQVERRAGVPPRPWPAGPDRRAAPRAARRGAAENVCTSSRPPSARGPSNRAARTSRAIACSAARYRGASSSASKSRNATTSASVDAVQHGLGADVHAGLLGRQRRLAPVTATTGRLAAASQLLAQPADAGAHVGQRARPAAPGTPVDARCRSAGSASAPSSRCSTAASQRSHTQQRPARRGTPAAGCVPAMLCTHTTRRVGSRRWAISCGRQQRPLPRLLRRVRSTTSTIGQPARSSATVGRIQRRPDQCSAVTVGHGDDQHARDVASARRARWRRRGRATSACAPPAAPRRARRAPRSRRSRARWPTTALRAPITTSTAARGRQRPVGRQHRDAQPGRPQPRGEHACRRAPTDAPPASGPRRAMPTTIGEQIVGRVTADDASPAVDQLLDRRARRRRARCARRPWRPDRAAGHAPSSAGWRRPGTDAADRRPSAGPPTRRDR